MAQVDDSGGYPAGFGGSGEEREKLKFRGPAIGRFVPDFLESEGE